MITDIWSLISPKFISQPEQIAWLRRLPNSGHKACSYEQIYQYANRYAKLLKDAGVGVGDIVTIFAPNGPEWGIAALAVWKLGAIVAPVHPGNSDHDIKVELEALAPKVVMCHGESRPIPNTIKMQIDLEGDFEDAIGDDSNLVVDLESEAVRIYTSGSTGNSKIVRLSHRNIVSNIVALSKLMAVDRSDRFLSLLPLSHTMELTGGFLFALYSGSTIVLPRVLAASEILEALREEKISLLVGVPRLYRNIMLGLDKRFRQGGSMLGLYLRILKCLPVFLRRRLNWPIRKHLGGNIKVWISGGSRLDPKISGYFQQLGLPLIQGYGLTETSPVISMQKTFDSILDSVGDPLEEIEVKIHNADDKGHGELWVKGPNVMLGYLTQAQNDQVFEDGWFKTGDLACIDQDRKITITGRLKRLIVTEAGKNVYPEELETLLERLDGVKEAGVFEMNLRPAAVLAVDESVNFDGAKQLIQEFNKLVSSHNRIFRFALTNELPRTPVGKVAIKDLPKMFSDNEVAS